MALALAPHGIRVNAIGPGSIMTEVLQSVVRDKAALSQCVPHHMDPVPFPVQAQKLLQSTSFGIIASP